MTTRTDPVHCVKATCEAELAKIPWFSARPNRNRMGRGRRKWGPHRIGHPPNHSGFRMVEKNQRLSFSVHCVPNLFDPRNETLARHLAGGRCFLLMDSAIALHHEYRSAIDLYLRRHSLDTVAVPLPSHPHNEQIKVLNTVDGVVARLAERDPEQGDWLIVIGGGVASDLGSYVAANYRRGLMRPLYIPTTLTAMVDAAISPKSSVDAGGHKNSLGTVESPDTVFWDPAFLRTVGRRHLAAGMAEMVKIAIVHSEPLFRCLERHARELLRARFQGRLGQAMIEMAILQFLRAKYEGPYPGNRPASIRAFGHAFSRRLEELAAFDAEHGEMVAVEMCVAANISYFRGILSWDDRERIFELLAVIGLPRNCPYCQAQWLWPVFERRVREGRPLHFPIPGQGIGRGQFLSVLTESDLREAILFLPREDTIIDTIQPEAA